MPSPRITAAGPVALLERANRTDKIPTGGMPIKAVKINPITSVISQPRALNLNRHLSLPRADPEHHLGATARLAGC
jgi:hypothetical protein